MCNFEATESIRDQVKKLVVHTGELRDRFVSVEEEFREGNLSAEALTELSQAIHLMEKDTAAFETLVEA